MRRTRGRRLAGAAALVIVVALGGACSEPSASEDPGEQPFPDVVEATLVARSDTVFDVEVTISSPYDTSERYADGWRVLTPDGTELGAHTLLHDHADEQPFTRVQRDLEIPPDVGTVVVEGRDLVNGYGGQTVEVAVPGR